MHHDEEVAKKCGLDNNELERNLKAVDKKLTEIIDFSHRSIVVEVVNLCKGKSYTYYQVLKLI